MANVWAQLGIIWTEISTDPNAIGYQGKTSAQIADLGRTTLEAGAPAASVASADIVRAFLKNDGAFSTVFATMTEAQKAQLDMLISGGTMDLRSGTPARIFLEGLWPAENTSPPGPNDALRADVGTLLGTQITRWQKLGITGRVGEAHVRAARIHEGGEGAGTIDGPLP